MIAASFVPQVCIQSTCKSKNYCSFRNLTTLIESYLNGDRGKRVALENYLVWQLVKGMRNTLSEKYRDTGKKLEKALFGKESHHERYEDGQAELIQPDPIHLNY